MSSTSASSAGRAGLSRRTGLARSAVAKGGRRKKCRVCQDWFKPTQPMQVVCSPKCAIEYGPILAAKKRRKEKREGRKKLKTLSQLCGEAQVAVNAYVRARDASKGCISCDSPEIHDAGHYFPIGRKYVVNRIRLDARVIHGQCAQCNRYKGGGNKDGYTAGILARYGAEYLRLMNDIKSMADQGQLPALTKDEVREIAAGYRRKKRELE